MNRTEHSMQAAATFDPIWENEIYGQGRHLNRYPYDFLVSFVARHAPRQKPRREIGILEVGCGAGNNLWFAAREGFQVAGIDASPSAIAFVHNRFAEEGLKGDLRVGDFTCLPFPSDGFDLALDRAALSCCSFSTARQAIAEVRRTLRIGGKFLFNPYSDRHSSFASGQLGPEGLTLDIREGSLTGVGLICFYGRREIAHLFATGWRLLSVLHIESVEELLPQRMVHAEWRVIAEKVEA